MKEIKEWIKNHQGLNLKSCKDENNRVKLGYGRHIESTGISKQEADFMFDNDFVRCQRELNQYEWYSQHPRHVQDALLNMNFNIGINQMLSFKKMISALTCKDYTRAALEIIDSQWAKRVGRRAKDVALMMKQG